MKSEDRFSEDGQLNKARSKPHAF